MDDDLRDAVRRAAEVHALVNAVEHGSEAQTGAVLGPLMGDNPEFREHGDEVPAVVGEVVARVNSRSAAERRERLAELAPDRLAEVEADDDGDDGPALPDLPNATAGEVTMRVAPNPNGPWHVGHARMAAVIGTYKQRYDGRFVCRFDDTDPDTKRPDLDAYGAILDAIDYLGFTPDEVIRASDRLETYYDHARDLIDAGGAYACSCPQAEFSELKNAGEACPHRDKTAEQTHAEFERMVDGDYGEGEMVLRVRTEIEHPNPALRDWVAFRVVDRPHPRETAADYRCWPMLDFQSGVDDHLTGVSHIVRGIDLQDSAKRQGFVYDYFGWTYPEVVHWGHVQVDEFDAPLSTSTLSEMVADGRLDGWDDPRAPTLAALERRGVRGEAVVAAMVELGTSTSDVELSMSSVYAKNRELVDDRADRYFLVRNGERLPLTDVPAEGTPPVHPDHEERGRRSIPVDGAVCLESDDVPTPDGRVWLKGLGCVRRSGDRLVGTDDGIEAVREGDVPVVHWVPDDGVPVRLRTPDGDVTGRAEPGFAGAAVDEVVQFERVCFARVDARDPAVAYVAHR
jgi:glutamyl-tRNA synthetase